MSSPPSVLRFLLVTIALATLAWPGATRLVARQPAEALDLVLAGGRVVDGTGAAWFFADVGIRGDRIARIGDLREVAATSRIDVSGLVVAPGFIDPHVHARARLFELPTAEGYLRWPGTCRLRSRSAC